MNVRVGIVSVGVLRCSRCGASSQRVEARGWSIVRVELLDEGETVIETLCDDCTSKLGDFVDGIKP